MSLRNNTLIRELTEIVKALPAKKLTYSAFLWSAPFTVLASLLTTSHLALNQSEFIRWIFILCLAHLSMLPFIVYGQEDRALKIQFPLLGLMALTRGLSIAILEPLFRIDLQLPLYVEILNSVVVLFYFFSIFAIVNFFRITVRADIKGVLEESMLQKRDLAQSQLAQSQNSLIEKIIEIQKKLTLAAGTTVTRQSLQEQAREIDLLIRNHVRPLSHSEWRKGELVQVPGGFRSVFRSALSKRLIPVLGVSFFAIPFYFKYSTLASGFLQAIYIVFTFNLFVGLAWLWSHRSPQFGQATIFRKNRAFFAFLFFFVFPLNTTLELFSPFGDARFEDSIRQNFLLYFFLSLFCLLAVVALQLIQEEKTAISLIRSELASQKPSATPLSQQASVDSLNYAQYLHAEVHSQLLGCKLLLLKSAESESPQFTPEMLRLINQKLQALAQPYSPSAEKTPSERISEFFSSWSGIVRIESVISPDIDKSGEAGTYAAQIIEESVVNAVRHGQATEIRVVLEVLAGQITITISNNGSLIESNSDTGLGSLLFDTFTSEWSIGVENSKVESRFKIPLTATL
jgi:signal transduction histidine kinase